jgi:hypothetical protein
MATNLFPKKKQVHGGSSGFMSPLRSFMYNTSNGFNLNSTRHEELPAVLTPAKEAVEGFSHTKFRHFHKFHTRASEFLLHSTNHKLERGGGDQKSIQSPILSKLKAVNPQRLR